MNVMLKISIITVVYNDAKGLSSTIRSVLDQDYPNIEYIVIDGGSNDGSLDIIAKNAANIDYWVSEPDDGIYNAMNKGLSHAHGDYVLFLNSSDEFVNSEVVSKTVEQITPDLDVIYGSSVQINSDGKHVINKPFPLSDITEYPIFRHNAAFFKLSLHKQFLFAENRKHELGFALDYDAIYRMYMSGAKFKEIDLVIMSHNMLGVSNNIAQSLIYNYRITKSQRNFFDWVVLQLKVLKYRYLLKGKNIY